MKKLRNKISMFLCLTLLLVTTMTASAASDIYEPNNDLESAKQICPHLFSSQGIISYGGDCDYFKFTPNGSGYLKLKLTPPAGKCMHMRVSKKDEWVPPFEEELLGEVDSLGQPVILPITVTEGVTYYIRIDGEPSNESYEIGKEAFDYSNDAAYEDNNSCDKRHEINLYNNSIIATISSPEDVDHYKFYSNRTETVKFGLSAPCNRNYQVFIIDNENGNVIGRGNTSSQYVQFSCSLVKDRQYNIIIHGVNYCYMSNVPYQLSLSR